MVTDNTPQISDLVSENKNLKRKLAFSIGALEGINFLLKINDPALMEQNLEHLKKVVDRVVEDLKRED